MQNVEIRKRNQNKVYDEISRCGGCHFSSSFEPSLIPFSHQSYTTHRISYFVFLCISFTHILWYCPQISHDRFIQSSPQYIRIILPVDVTYPTALKMHLLETKKKRTHRQSIPTLRFRTDKNLLPQNEVITVFTQNTNASRRYWIASVDTYKALINICNACTAIFKKTATYVTWVMLISGLGQALCRHYELIQIRSLNSHFEQSDTQTLKVPPPLSPPPTPPPPWLIQSQHALFWRQFKYVRRTTTHACWGQQIYE